jgi:hypothetical protein
VIDAADAVGFWSPANNLSQRVAEGSPPILPRSGIAVVNADGRLWAYFIGSTGTAPDAPLDLFAVEIPDPTSEDPVDRPIVHALGAGEDLLPEFDVAATYAGWEVWLAHHVADAGTRPGGTVRIHHGLPESPLTSIETLPQPRETNGEITIAWHMGRLYMVWGDRGTGVLPVSFLNCRTWPGDSACYPMVCREATPGGTMVCPPGSQGRFPQLVPPPASGAPLWLVDGAESCLGSGCDPQFTLEARMLADSWEWSAPQGLRVMTPQARNSTESNLQPFAVGPLGAAWHAGHLQVVSQRSPFARPSEISHVTEASFEHFPAGTFTEDVKAVELEAEAAGRPALVRWLDPLGRWLVVMFWRTADPATPRLMAAYKRSD